MLEIVFAISLGRFARRLGRSAWWGVLVIAIDMVFVVFAVAAGFGTLVVLPAPFLSGGAIWAILRSLGPLPGSQLEDNMAKGVDCPKCGFPEVERLGEVYYCHQCNHQW